MISNESNESAIQGRSFSNFLKRKNVVVSWHRYGIEAMSAMAQGLFASLLVGTILATIGDLSGIAWFNEFGAVAKKVAGPAMAIAIGYALKAPLLVLLSLSAVGMAANEFGGAGGPLAVLVIAIIAAELGKMVADETSVDILVTPLVVICAGYGLSSAFAPAIGGAASSLGAIVMWATDLMPLFMGMIVACVVGIALTLPISSAAICAALGLTGLAGGAALAGCCAQMVGFAVISYKANGVSGIVSQGLGTSMLQVPNILRNPKIWIPPTIASAVGGVLATCVFGLCQDGPAIASGMGTCGLVGPIGVVTGWASSGIDATFFDWLGLIVVCFVSPIVASIAVYLPMRKAGMIKDSDMSLVEGVAEYDSEEGLAP